MIREVRDDDILNYSSGEIKSHETVSRKKGISNKGGLYDLSIFGSIDSCLCGIKIFPGYRCSKCNVLGIKKSDVLKHGGYFKMPAPMISRRNLKKLRSKLYSEYLFKIPSSIEKLWDFEKNGKYGTFALIELSEIQGMKFVREYLNELLYISHPYFRPLHKDSNDNYIINDYTKSLSLFINSCNIVDINDNISLKNLNIFYDELLNYSDGHKTGKDGGLRKLLRYNFVDKCISGIIIPNPNIPVDSIGIHRDVLLNVIGGDYSDYYGVLIRYPILHKYNMMSFKVIDVDYAENCIHLNPLIVQPFGGDFDGDTMQVILSKKINPEMFVSNNMYKDKNKEPIFSLKGEYEGKVSNNDISQDFIHLSNELTFSGIPAFSFDGDNDDLCSFVPKIKGKTINSLFNPMYNLKSSLINGLDVDDFLDLSVINRNILSFKQDFVAISGYNTRQLVIATWGSNPSAATSFTEGMTQRALSLKHGGDNSLSYQKINKEPIVNFNGNIAESSSEFFYLSDNYCIKNGDVVSKKKIPVYGKIFPIMKLLGFDIGSLNPEYIEEYSSFNVILNYSESDGFFDIVDKDKYKIGDKIYSVDCSECFLIRPGAYIHKGTRILSGICNLPYYCNIFDKELMKSIFADEIYIHSGINFNKEIIDSIFESLYEYNLNVRIAIKNKKDFFLQWYSSSLKNALKYAENVNESVLTKILGLSTEKTWGE